MVQVVKDSHYWPSIKVFLNWLECSDYGCHTDFNPAYIRTGFLNAQKRGYDLRKKSRSAHKSNLTSESSGRARRSPKVKFDYPALSRDGKVLPLQTLTERARG
jgi:hypothetical protein